MDNDNRIQSLSMAESTSRQTPRNEFGAVMATTLRNTVQVGSSLMASVVGSSPLLSAAVSGVQGVLGAAAAQSPNLVSGITGVGGAEAKLAAGADGEAWGLHRAQATMQKENQQFSQVYLALQREMQEESRQFNAISNILKVRHDSAKAAINNIR